MQRAAAAPSPSFKMSQPHLLLEFLIVAFDAPAQFGGVDQIAERDVLGKCRQPIFGRLRLALGPFDEEPFFRRLRGTFVTRCDASMQTGKT